MGDDTTKSAAYTPVRGVNGCYYKWVGHRCSG